MLREIQQNPNIIYFWMTREEHNSNYEQLATEYQRWNDTGYQVCAFISGKEDLPKLTQELLVQNSRALVDRIDECPNT